MIFVTVGTHEQPFNRLLKCIDDMIDKDLIKEEVIAQIGYSTYKPKNYKTKKLISYEEMQEYIKNARIVVTHGGPSSFIAPLAIGKIPVVVPRKKEFGEHVNNHQVEFTKEVEKRMKNIIVALNDEEIIDSIVNYDEKICKLNNNNISHNKEFNDLLKKEIEKIL
jgi:UDP-N-acetylglucosamine transferase subunit ALG13